jgi:hypothetical protein
MRLEGEGRIELDTPWRVERDVREESPPWSGASGAEPVPAAFSTRPGSPREVEAGAEVVAAADELADEQDDGCGAEEVAPDPSCVVAGASPPEPPQVTSADAAPAPPLQLDLQALSAQLKAIQERAALDVSARALEVGLAIARRALGAAPPVSEQLLATWVREALEAYPSIEVVLAVAPSTAAAIGKELADVELEVVADPAIPEGTCELRYAAGMTIAVSPEERFEILTQHLESAA